MEIVNTGSNPQRQPETFAKLQQQPEKLRNAVILAQAGILAKFTQ